MATALLIGAATAFLHWSMRGTAVIPDLAPIWWSARALLQGGDPYASVGPNGTLYLYPYPQLYPLPAILLIAPLVAFPIDVATSLFAGLGAGVLAYAVARDGYRRLPIFLSAGFFWSVNLAQWSPLLVGAALIPVLGFVFVVKPTIGLALFLYKPTRVAVIGGAVLVLLSFLLRPTWPASWLPILAGHAVNMVAPVEVLGGPLLLLGLLKWKRPEARLLVALSLIPQTPLPYEGLLLFLVATSLVEAGLLAVLAWVGAELLLMQVHDAMPTREKRELAMRMMVFTGYLPALLMLLRRPNEGDTPVLLGQLREWLRAPFSLRRRPRTAL